MKRLSLLAPLILLAAACTSESELPTPTGKGTVRALNAIQGSPEITFRIEETFLAAIGYKQTSGSRRWDDFQYRFNFEALFPGESSARRVASRSLTVEAGEDYTFVLTGNVAAPEVRVWQSPERAFTGTETVFEARFAHAAASLGAIDVFLLPPGIAPATGTELGTLDYGEMLAPFDIDAGDYVVTATAAGTPTDVVFVSNTIGFNGGNAYVIPVLDGDGNDVAPVTVRRINAAGGDTRITDSRFPPTIRFIHASPDLLPSDVYDDEMLTNRVLSGHAFGDITADIPASVGTLALTYTGVGNSGAIQFEGSLIAAAGTHNNFIVIGEEGSRRALTLVPDRQSVSNVVKLQVIPASVNHQALDLYVVAADESIDSAVRLGSLAFGLPTGNISLAAGSYDVYLTVLDEKTVLSGPIRIDAGLGDIVEAVVLDTTDPAIAEFVVVPAP